MRSFLCFFAALILAGCSPEPAPAIAIEQGWARATPAGAASGAAYLTIVNRGGGDDRLIEIAVEGAASATLHNSSHEGGVMRMRAMPEGLAIPARSSVALAPNGAHLMLTGLAAPLRPGDKRNATLRFERSGPMQTMIMVEDAAR